MTIHDDQKTGGTNRQNKRSFNKELHLDSSDKLTKTANISIEDGVAPSSTTSLSTVEAATKPRTDSNDANKHILRDLAKLSKSMRLVDRKASVDARKAQSKLPENKGNSLGVEQPHTRRNLKFSGEDNSCKETQEKQNLDPNPSPMARDLQNTVKRLSDDDLMVVLEHCFDNFDFTSISLTENSERKDLGDINALKEIFSGDVHNVNNDMTNDAKQIFDDENKIDTTGDKKSLKSHRLRKRRFLKHLIHVKPIRTQLERMLPESAYVERFLSKKKRKREISVKQDDLTQSSVPVQTVSHIMSCSRPTKDKGLETRLEKGNADVSVSVGIGDRSGSRSKIIEGVNEILDDNSDHCHLKKPNHQKHQNDGRFASKKSESGNNTTNVNVRIANHEGSGCSPLQQSRHEVRSSKNSECRVRVENLGGNEKPKGNTSRLSKKGSKESKSIPTGNSISEESSEILDGPSRLSRKGSKESKSIPTGNSLSEESCEIRDGPFDLDETKEQGESTALLRSPHDQRRHRVCSNHVANRTSLNMDGSFEVHNRVVSRLGTARKDSMNDRREADSTDVKDDRIKKFNTAMNFWASLAVINDQSNGDKINLEENEEKVSLVSDSESSGIGSFETAELYEGPFPFLPETTDKKEPRTKVTSVTMDDGSLRTCFSREVSLGGPSSDGEDSNLMESSISGIVEKKEKTNRAQCIDYGRRTTILLLVTIGLFAFGVFLGFMSNKKHWDIYKTDNGFET